MSAEVVKKALRILSVLEPAQHTVRQTAHAEASRLSSMAKEPWSFSAALACRSCSMAEKSVLNRRSSPPPSPSVAASLRTDRSTARSPSGATRRDASAASKTRAIRSRAEVRLSPELEAAALKSALSASERFTVVVSSVSRPTTKEKTAAAEPSAEAAPAAAAASAWLAPFPASAGVDLDGDVMSIGSEPPSSTSLVSSGLSASGEASTWDASSSERSSSSSPSSSSSS
mmetsp:Transcript_3521/g.14609  ORF Transcript_3521/g.14609 Transcript_3521/m.14609 type:complete len:229 (-) Transcript_3521:4715-5401(-)